MPLFSAENKKDYINSKTVIYFSMGIVCVYVLTMVFPSLYLRLIYTGELEHQEGVFANTVHFLKSGGNIYQPPDIHFAGTIYPPLYFYLAAFITKFIPLDFFSLRLISFVSMFLTAFFSCRIIQQTTNSIYAGLLWLPLFLVYWTFFGWIDIARMEAMFMCLLMAGFWLLYSKDSSLIRYLASGILFGLAAATKQTGFLLFPFIIWVSFFNRKTLPCLISFFLTGVAAYSFFYKKFGPHLFDWVITVPGNHGFLPLSTIYDISITWFLTSMGLVIPAIFLIYKNRQNILDVLRGRRPNDITIVTFFAACCAMISWASTIKIGGIVSSLIFANAFFALLSCLKIGDVIKSKTPASLILSIVFSSFIFLSIAATLIHKNIDTRTPRKEDALQYEYLINYVRNEPGKVWMMCNPWISQKAGKESFVALQQAREWYLAIPHSAKTFTISLFENNFDKIINCGQLKPEKIPSHSESFPGFQRKFQKKYILEKKFSDNLLMRPIDSRDVGQPDLLWRIKP